MKKKQSEKSKSTITMDVDRVLAKLLRQHEENKTKPIAQKRALQELLDCFSDMEEDDSDMDDKEIRASRWKPGGTRPQSATTLALADYRNYVSAAAMHMTATDVTPNLIFSFAPIDFILLPDATHCYVHVSQKETFVPSWPVHTAIHAKHFAIHSAAGEMGPDIFLIKSDSITKSSEFKFFRVPKLTANARDGYIMFGARCAGTTQIFTKVLKDIVIPFIVEQQQKQPPGSDKRAYLMVDGEPNALPQCIMNNSDGIMELFLQHNVTVAKVPVLCADTTQPAAGGKWIAAVTDLMQNLRFHSIRWDKIEPVDEISRRMRENYKPLEVNEEVKKNLTTILQEVNYWHRIVDQMTIAILHLSHCLETLQTKEAIVQNFADAGVYPFDANVIVNRCKSKQRLSEAECTDLVTKTPVMSQHFNSGGVLEDDVMDDLNVCIDPAATAKREERDVSVLFRQRGLILTHPSVIARFGGKSTLKIMQKKSVRKDEAFFTPKKRGRTTLQTPSSGNVMLESDHEDN